MNISSNPIPLFLLPGLLCDDTVWQPQREGLAEFDLRVLSGYNGARSIEAMAACVLEQAPDRFAVCGHSMGGRVALEVVHQAPERVERLAVLDTGVHPEQPGEREKRFALLTLGREQGIEALVDAWLPPMVHPDRRNDEAFMRPLREMCIAAGVEQFEDQITALLSRPDAGRQLGDIHCPTLVATGAQDEWSPPSQHEPIAEAIDGARLVIFEHSGHMSTVEAPEAVNRALRDWMNQD